MKFDQIKAAFRRLFSKQQPPAAARTLAQSICDELVRLPRSFRAHVSSEELRIFAVSGDMAKMGLAITLRAECLRVSRDVSHQERLSNTFVNLTGGEMKAILAAVMEWQSQARDDDFDVDPALIEEVRRNFGLQEAAA